MGTDFGSRRHLGITLGSLGKSISLLPSLFSIQGSVLCAIAPRTVLRHLEISLTLANDWVEQCGFSN